MSNVCANETPPDLSAGPIVSGGPAGLGITVWAAHTKPRPSHTAPPTHPSREPRRRSAWEADILVPLCPISGGEGRGLILNKTPVHFSYPIIAPGPPEHDG